MSEMVQDGLMEQCLENNVSYCTWAGKVEDPKPGRVMEINTVSPGIQFYTGNFPDGTAKGKEGQYWLVLRPGETDQSTDLHKFYTE